MSFSEAAKHLYLTQPTISHHIKTLERELGVELFIRSGATLKHNIFAVSPYLLHLRAFTLTLEKQTGETYQPQYLDPAAYETIVNTPTETGGGGQWRGQRQDQ